MAKHRLLHKWHEWCVTWAVCKIARALANHLGWNPGDDGERRHIFGNHGPRSYDAALADRHTCQYLDPGTKPRMLFDDYWATLHTKRRIRRVMLERP